MRHRLVGLTVLMLVVMGIGCTVSRQPFDPNRKYPKQQLQQDYHYFRSILEESHPSLYWFTPKDSMDHYFKAGYEQLNDSLTEPQFKNILSYVISKIRCGHTAVRHSKPYTNYLDTVKMPIFPLHLKVWKDSMSVVGNLNRKDAALRRGTIVTKINGISAQTLTDSLLNYISGDGYALSGKYQTLSNRGSFGSLYRTVIGLPDSLTVDYLDTAGEEQETIVPVYDPRADTLNRPPATRPGGQGRPGKGPRKPEKKEPKEQFLNYARNVQIDTSLSSAYMTVNTFNRGNRLRSFYRKAFRQLKKNHIQHLVVDVRSNGGGDAGISTKLTRYLTDHRFKLADSLYAVRRTSHYSRYIQWQPAYWAMMLAVTRKHKDGLYHFGFFERHYFKPQKKNHFDGDIYIITGGNSFSATTLFAAVLKGQSNVKIVGEETGGGAYGNTAWMIPDVTLPNTGLRFRLPKFRLVMNQDQVKEGRGIMPDIIAQPTVESIRHNIDPKVDTVRKLIMQKNGLAHSNSNP